MFKYRIDKDIELRLLQVSHTKELLNLMDSCRSYLAEWLPWGNKAKTYDDVKGFIERTMKQFGSNDGFQAGIWYRGELAGVIGYHRINWCHRSTSIGYWLAEQYTGHGIMTKACEAFINYALIDLNLNRVEIRCAEENVKSRAIPERLNFSKEGLIREAEWLHDHYVNHVVYGILAKDWKSK